MPKVPKALSGHKGVLPKLPGAAYMGPGKLGKSGMLTSHDPAALWDDLILALCASGCFPSVDLGSRGIPELSMRWGRSSPSTFRGTGGERSRTVNKDRAHPL